MEEPEKPKLTSDNTKAYSPFNKKDPSLAEYFSNYPSAQRYQSSPDSKIILIIGPHRYYNQFTAQLAEVKLTRSGTFKNPLTILNPLDLIWGEQRSEVIKFYASIARFETYYERSQADLEGLKALISNPVGYGIYLHDSSISEKPNIRSIRPVQISKPKVAYRIKVELQDNAYILTPLLTIGHTAYPTDQVKLRLDYFLTWGDFWYLCEDLNLLQCITYFIRHNNCMRLAPDEFTTFQQEVLSTMEMYVTVDYTFAKPAPVEKDHFYHSPEKLIYLTDQADHVCIHPVVKYGKAEVPLLSRRQVFDMDTDGNSYHMGRNASIEDAFLSMLIRQHPDFKEQLENPLLYFYLHKSRFLNQDWFLQTFEEWANLDITVLGFNEIEGNKLNPNKVSINIHVISGLNWFNAEVDVRFGKKKAALKEVQKAVKAKSRFVKLDDGTMGILPKEWLHQLESYFGAGEVEGDSVKIPKINFSMVSDLFEEQMLDKEVKEELNNYQSQLSGLDSLPLVSLPEDLHATLRPYQVQGLSWLNFLDDFNFGGCLADDMGLGKTVQIIAFILLLRKKHGKNMHLLVVPTSLIHNWQAEIVKFAPSISVHVHHGPDRMKVAADFPAHELIITTYSTMVSDITFLRRHMFAYIFLDESQNIKNITSQRYKAARLLQSRNKVVLSGTPMENNTFDLYAQFSFACPGLLGTRSFFRNTYAVTIDKFKNKRSANDLQRKISPFMLRRTKKEVARELPEKTEVVLHCEMGPEQRKIYDAYEREFREYISAADEEEIIKHPMNVLKGITKLRQICNAPVLAGVQVTSKDTSAKISMLMEQLQSITKNHKVLIFSQFVSMLELIQRELRQEDLSHVCLTGKTQNRQVLVDRFQQDEDTRIFLISLKAGGTGLNLTAADYVFLIDPWWNPAVENQAIDRSHRIGQEKKVIAVRMISPDTVEEKIQIMQRNKSKLVNSMVTTDSFFKSLSRKDWLGLV